LPTTIASACSRPGSPPAPPNRSTAHCSRPAARSPPRRTPQLSRTSMDRSWRTHQKKSSSFLLGSAGSRMCKAAPPPTARRAPGGASPWPPPTDMCSPTTTSWPPCRLRVPVRRLPANVVAGEHARHKARNRLLIMTENGRSAATKLVRFAVRAISSSIKQQ
jgi:hypothetical protein